MDRFACRSHLLPRSRATLGLALLVSLSAAAGSYAQGNVPIVRDAEIEALVRDYARPIFKAAGLTKSGIDIVLVNDPSFNAFVAGRRMFINTGALLQAETPNEIIGVIAHEAGHIAGGHQERLREQLARAQTMAVDRHRCSVSARWSPGRQPTRANSPAPAPASWRAATRRHGAACSATSARRSRRPTARPSPISRRPGSRRRAC